LNSLVKAHEAVVPARDGQAQDQDRDHDDDETADPPFRHFSVPPVPMLWSILVHAAREDKRNTSVLIAVSSQWLVEALHLVQNWTDDLKSRIAAGSAR
jgi:hypothetical protein